MKFDCLVRIMAFNYLQGEAVWLLLTQRTNMWAVTLCRMEISTDSTQHKINTLESENQSNKFISHVFVIRRKDKKLWWHAEYWLGLWSPSAVVSSQKITFVSLHTSLCHTIFFCFNISSISLNLCFLNKRETLNISDHGKAKVARGNFLWRKYCLVAERFLRTYNLWMVWVERNLKDHLVPGPLMPLLDAQGTLWLLQAGVSS